MITPFEQKSRLAGTLDQLGLRALLLGFCFLWFYRLWSDALPAAAAALALYTLLWYTLSLWRRRALIHREAALRAHIGGTLAVEALLLCTPGDAAYRVGEWLRHEHALHILRAEGNGVLLTYDAETLLLLCMQTHPQQQGSASDVLAANRTLLSVAGATRCILCCPGSFTAEAEQVAESVEPPVRLLDGAALRALSGRLAPASDVQLVAMGKKQRKPFSWTSLRPLVFSPQKTRRYAAYGAGLMAFFVVTNQLYYLIPSGLCWMLAIWSQRQRRKPQRL